MTNQEAKIAWAEGKKLEYQIAEGESWVPLGSSTPIGIFDRYGVQFRLVPEPVVLECVVEESGGGKAVHCGEKVVARCYDFGIDPPLGTRVKLTVEVE